MKNLKKILIVILLSIFIVPITLTAEEEYNTLDFKETLKEEGITEKFSNYEETDDQITIYMFRGKGCGYCRSFLEFMNSIADEYGKYFKLKSFETWYDSNNADYLKEVSKFMGEEAEGVPYIIIGDKVFTGYSESYDEEIKSEIKKLYDTPIEERYDVIEKLPEGEKEVSKTSKENTGIIIFNIILTIVLFGISIIYFGKKNIELEKRIVMLEENFIEKNKKEDTKKIVETKSKKIVSKKYK